MADELWQNEQIEKLWDAIQDLREARHTNAEGIREIRTALFGLGGKNGLRSLIQGNSDAIKELRVRVETGYKTCHWGEKMIEHLDSHKKKESGALTARRFYIGQVVTVLIFLAGLWFKT
jgi:hypothetical protein